MLGQTCPRCGRRNAVGDRPQCAYCGASLDGSAAPATASGAPPPPPEEEGVGDWIAGLARLWPVRLIAFLLAFLLLVMFYKTAMEHYAPAVRGRPAAPPPR